MNSKIIINKSYVVFNLSFVELVINYSTDSNRSHIITFWIRYIDKYSFFYRVVIYNKICLHIFFLISTDFILVWIFSETTFVEQNDDDDKHYDNWIYK